MSRLFKITLSVSFLCILLTIGCSVGGNARVIEEQRQVAEPNALNEVNVVDSNDVIRVVLHPLYGTYAMLVHKGTLIGDQVAPERGIYLCEEFYHNLILRLEELEEILAEKEDLFNIGF